MGESGGEMEEDGDEGALRGEAALVAALTEAASNGDDEMLEGGSDDDVDGGEDEDEEMDESDDGARWLGAWLRSCGARAEQLRSEQSPRRRPRAASSRQRARTAWRS